MCCKWCCPSHDKQSRTKTNQTHYNCSVSLWLSVPLFPNESRGKDTLQTHTAAVNVASTHRYIDKNRVSIRTLIFHLTFPQRHTHTWPNTSSVCEGQSSKTCVLYCVTACVCVSSQQGLSLLAVLSFPRQWSIFYRINQSQSMISMQINLSRYTIVQKLPKHSRNILSMSTWITFIITQHLWRMRMGWSHTHHIWLCIFIQL